MLDRPSRNPSSTPSDEWRSPLWFDLVEKILVAILAGILLSVFLVAAYHNGELSLLKAALLIFLGILTLLFGIQFIRALQNGDVPQVESHWGGFGAGLGGWRMSQSLAYLLATVSFAGILVLAARRDLEPPAEKSAAPAAKPATATKGPGADATGESKRPEPGRKESNAAPADPAKTEKDSATQPSETKTNE